MNLSFRKGMALCSLTLIVMLSACSKNNDSTPGGQDPYGNTPVTTPATSSLALTTNAKFGSILTDANGKSLYAFAIDANGTSGCSGSCAIAWMPYYAGNETAPTGIKATDISTITRADGKKQTVYKGWPLYYFSGDTNKGDVNGDGSGGTWFIAKPDYSVMFANSQLVGGFDGKNYTADGKEGTGITQYLTDAAGRTLYAYAPDKFNLNTYTKADLSNDGAWPIYESDVLNVPSVIKKDMLVQITAAGKKQLTYKGHPLYYFGADAKRGDTKGVNVGAGLWPILTVNTIALTP